MKKFLVNGRFLTRPTTGVDRFAREVVRELDKIIEHGFMEVLVPKGTPNLPKYKNIGVIEYGGLKGISWEQIQLPYYAIRHNRFLLNLCNAAPIIKTDLVCIHDMQFRAFPEFFSWKYVLWYRFLFAFITRNAKKVCTVSNFSKKEIKKYYPNMKAEVTVVYSGWQHMLRIKSDEDIFRRYPAIQRNQYFFAMSSIAKNKNFKWVIKTAKNNPDYTFVIAGKVNKKVFGDVVLETVPNVIQLGYVTDSEAKALMENCLAFLYPSFYEGFGLPPLEALSVGADIVVSDIEVMHEIYYDWAHFIDPRQDNYYVYQILEQETFKMHASPCANFHWKDSALRIFSILNESF